MAATNRQDSMARNTNNKKVRQKKHRLGTDTKTVTGPEGLNMFDGISLALISGVDQD